MTQRLVHFWEEWRRARTAVVVMRPISTEAVRLVCVEGELQPPDEEIIKRLRRETLRIALWTLLSGLFALVLVLTFLGLILNVAAQTRFAGGGDGAWLRLAMCLFLVIPAGLMSGGLLMLLRRVWAIRRGVVDDEF